MHNHEDQFRQLANSIPQLAWMMDKHGSVYWYNDRWFEFTGTTLAEVEGWGWTKLHHPDHFDRVIKKFTKALENADNWEDTYPLRGRDGNYRWFLSCAFPIRDSKGKILRWFGTSTDITERLNIERSLRENEAFTRSILESSPDCIKVLDMEGRLLSMNEGGQRVMEIDNFSAYQLLPWTDFWKEESHALAMQAMNDARQGKNACFEGFCYTAKGKPKWWEVMLRPIIPHAEQINAGRILCISRDITHRKYTEIELQSALAEAQEAHAAALAANRKKDEFLANMSHELRTPLNAIIGIGHILAKTPPLNSKQADCIKTLQSSSESLLALINDLLDLAKIESENVELENIGFNMREMLEDVAAMSRVLAEEKNISLVLDYDRKLHDSYIGDPHRIRQIVNNLASNAIKFTYNGGVKISVKEVSSGHGLTTIAICFSDTGIGIAEDKIENIFNKFSQADTSVNRKFGGTGLGLAISRNLAVIMGGDILVQSKVGIGSEFTLQLPLLNHDSADLVKTPKSILQLFGKLKNPVSSGMEIQEMEPPLVLIVEDYKPNLLVACSYMDMLGLHYETASNGEEAVTLIKNNQYDIVLMDVQMPVMDGLSATRAIRKWENENGKSATPIIGVTAYALKGDSEKCFKAGMNDYITKPYKPETIRQKIEAVLDVAVTAQKKAAIA